MANDSGYAPGSSVSTRGLAQGIELRTLVLESVRSWRGLKTADCAEKCAVVSTLCTLLGEQKARKMAAVNALQAGYGDEAAELARAILERGEY